MIGFKGRLSFIQYLPKKPTKWGMKAFVLADSRNGYTYNWRLYTGEHEIIFANAIIVYVRIHFMHVHNIMDMHACMYA